MDSIKSRTSNLKQILSDFQEDYFPKTQLQKKQDKAKTETKKTKMSIYETLSKPMKFLYLITLWSIGIHQYILCPVLVFIIIGGKKGILWTSDFKMVLFFEYCYILSELGTIF